jgi:hypothetical protein
MAFRAGHGGSSLLCAMTRISQGSLSSNRQPQFLHRYFVIVVVWVSWRSSWIVRMLSTSAEKHSGQPCFRISRLHDVTWISLNSHWQDLHLNRETKTVCSSSRRSPLSKPWVSRLLEEHSGQAVMTLPPRLGCHASRLPSPTRRAR